MNGPMDQITCTYLKRAASVSPRARQCNEMMNRGGIPCAEAKQAIAAAAAAHAKAAAADAAATAAMEQTAAAAAAAAELESSLASTRELLAAAEAREASLKAAAAVADAKHAKQIAEAKDLARREGEARDHAHNLQLKKFEEKLANQSAEHKKAKEAAKRQLDEVTMRANAAAAKVSTLSAEVKALKKEKASEAEAAAAAVGGDDVAVGGAPSAALAAARSREKRAIGVVGEGQRTPIIHYIAPRMFCKPHPLVSETVPILSPTPSMPFCMTPSHHLHIPSLNPRFNVSLYKNSRWGGCELRACLIRGFERRTVSNS